MPEIMAVNCWLRGRSSFCLVLVGSSFQVSVDGEGSQSPVSEGVLVLFVFYLDSPIRASKQIHPFQGEDEVFEK